MNVRLNDKLRRVLIVLSLVMISFGSYMAGRSSYHVIVYSQEQPSRASLTLNSHLLLYENSSLLDKVNEVRKANGKPPLMGSRILDSTAQSKAEDLVTRNYWGHVDPDGEDYTRLIMDMVGGRISVVSENLAKCQKTDAGVIDGWKASQSHFETMIADADLFGEGRAYNQANNCWYYVTHYVKL